MQTDIFEQINWHILYKTWLRMFYTVQHMHCRHVTRGPLAHKSPRLYMAQYSRHVGGVHVAEEPQSLALPLPSAAWACPPADPAAVWRTSQNAEGALVVVAQRWSHAASPNLHPVHRVQRRRWRNHLCINLWKFDVKINSPYCGPHPYLLSSRFIDAHPFE